MAGHGPPPKPANERVRRNIDVPATVVEPDDEVRGPELPAEPRFVLGFGDEVEVIRSWPARTVKWWDTWRRSPQAQTFTDTDWDFLLDTAQLHALFWLGEVRHAPEIRIRLQQFGGTPADRMRLRLQVGKPATDAQPAAPKPKPAEDRDAAILHLVQDVG